MRADTAIWLQGQVECIRRSAENVMQVLKSHGCPIAEAAMGEAVMACNRAHRAIEKAAEKDGDA